jgi:hypothetical protein
MGENVPCAIGRASLCSWILFLEQLERSPPACPVPAAVSFAFSFPLPLRVPFVVDTGDFSFPLALALEGLEWEEKRGMYPPSSSLLLGAFSFEEEGASGGEGAGGEERDRDGDGDGEGWGCPLIALPPFDSLFCFVFCFPFSPFSPRPCPCPCPSPLANGPFPFPFPLPLPSSNRILFLCLGSPFSSASASGGGWTGSLVSIQGMLPLFRLVRRCWFLNLEGCGPRPRIGPEPPLEEEACTMLGLIVGCELWRRSGGKVVT